jgi:hypothetical protein
MLKKYKTKDLWHEKKKFGKYLQSFFELLLIGCVFGFMEKKSFGSISKEIMKMMFW